MKINLKRLVENYILEEDVLQHMGALINYFKSKPLNFDLATARYELSKFIEQPEIYDALFDATGDIIDLDAVFENSEFAQQIYNMLSGKDQKKFYNNFVNMKSDNPVSEPAFKYLKPIKQLPESTILVRFAKDGQFSEVQRDGGFRLGTNVIDRLHASSHFGNETKKNGGYLYAYVANSKEAKKQSKFTEVGSSYGANCIFFKYPGLLIDHELDGENQVIVYGPDIQGDECIFAKGSDEGFIIMNGGFNKDPKTYDEIIKLLGKI